MMQRRDIAEMLGLHGGERKQLTGILRQLLASGIIEQKKGMYRLRKNRKPVQGVFSRAERGYGFVCPDDKGQEDLFISARNAGTAMNGDLVSAQLSGEDRSGRRYGRIDKILHRANRTILGIYHQKRDRAWVMPLDSAITQAVYVQNKEGVAAEPGQVVKLEFLRYPAERAAGSGRIVEVLGDQDDPQIDIETVIRSHDLPRYFADDVVAEAKSVAVWKAADELSHRIDLRNLPLMTIDAETAKDFDDAVALKREADGRLRLWVCIADVAHYVAKGGALDQSARERGTSVYFPGYCLPMLPESLSNGICSLNPGEDRLVMTAELLFSPQGRRLESNFYPAVIQSQARLTYTEVAAFLDAVEDVSFATEIAEQLPLMAEFAEVLRSVRHKRGSLELDVPETEILLDKKGYPVAVVKCKRTIAHRLIEEFMLAANEAVSDFLEASGVPLLYRIHEPPTLEKLQDFQQLAAEFGYGVLLGKRLNESLQHLLDDIVDKPEAKLLNQQLLRSLQQARYTPENKGHFGLAADRYCHFTSPIRRYPDLTIHRALKHVLASADQTAFVGKERLLDLGRECSEKERRAMAAERHLFELRRCQLMQQHLGETFTGQICSVTEFGFFVELDDLGLEGLVHVRNLSGDFYSFDPLSHSLQGERRRKCYRVGMAVTVTVHHVDVWRRRIDFLLVE